MVHAEPVADGDLDALRALAQERLERYAAVEIWIHPGDPNEGSQGVGPRAATGTTRVAALTSRSASAIVCVAVFRARDRRGAKRVGRTPQPLICVNISDKTN
jgi:hypothetical protein